MSSSDQGALALAIAIAVILLVVGMIGLGMWCENKNWERMIVDSPDTVSAIRSRVLAERAEQEQESK